ncbi:7TM diverse intracellular signaling domain-containing protein [Tenacibaculum agarivorans]|uniref:7TM diverse intracellular signaling domain-containing protein n=1 Tax=Tenacibaculum agarivorans TaxID=1908389 RepID=UPI00094B7F1F|nr:7TM diverse intracellular signaling domain-containing protein [Tenacibaculum agarivorans]
MLKRTYYKLFFKILFFIGIGFTVSCSDLDSNQQPRLEKGVIDFSQVNFEEQPTTILQGDGLFYWKQWPLDDEGKFSVEKLQKPEKIEWPPVLWTTLDYPSKGYGTYRITLKRQLTNQKNKIILNIPRILGGAEVWINGRKVASHGKISKESTSEKLDGRPLRIELPEEAVLDIMFLISNHKHRLGGGIAMLNTIEDQSYFEQQNKTKPLLEGIITFVIILFGVGQIINFYSFPRYKFYLFFGLFCLLGASRQLFIGEVLIYNFFPNIDFSIVQRMRYIGYYGGLASVFLYQVYLLPGYINSKFVISSVVIALLGIVYVLLAPVYYTTLSAPFFQVYGLLFIGVGGYQVIRALKDGRPLAKVIALGVCVAAFLLANDLLNAMLIIQSKYLINYGLLVYVFFQILVNKKIQKQREKDLIQLSGDFEELSSLMDKKQEEISELKSESYKQIKSKEKLVENLKKVIAEDESISIYNIIADVKSELVEDANLIKIKSEMEELDNEFFNRLKDLHPNLTKTDLEICSLIRVGLRRKEIASVRNTSLEAVKSSRFRLKKKLNLSINENLDRYIKKL